MAPPGWVTWSRSSKSTTEWSWKRSKVLTPRRCWQERMLSQASSRGAAAGFGADEPAFVQQPGHPGGHVFHGVAVGGGDIEVVDAGGEGALDGLVDHGLGEVGAAEAGGAEGDDGAVVVYPAEFAAVHGWSLGVGLGRAV